MTTITASWCSQHYLLETIVHNQNLYALECTAICYVTLLHFVASFLSIHIWTVLTFRLLAFRCHIVGAWISKFVGILFGTTFGLAHFCQCSSPVLVGAVLNHWSLWLRSPSSPSYHRCQHSDRTFLSILIQHFMLPNAFPVFLGNFRRPVLYLVRGLGAVGASSPLVGRSVVTGLPYTVLTSLHCHQYVECLFGQPDALFVDHRTPVSTQQIFAYILYFV